MVDDTEKNDIGNANQPKTPMNWNNPPRNWNKHKYAFLLATRHYKMLVDEGRLAAFRNTILSSVNSDDVVADLGAGTGILSMIAAQKAKKVYAVELFPYLYELAQENAQRYGLSDRITFVQHDARTVVLPETVDVIICEMVHTGCIAEHQIPVMNHALKTFLKPSGRVIPKSITTNAQLITTNYHFNGYEMKLPHYQNPTEIPWEISLSPIHRLREFDLTTINPLSATGTVTVQITRDGILNGLKITSEVFLTPSLIVTEKDMTSSLEPIIFPLDDQPVAPGDEVQIEFFYEPGAGAEGFHYNVTIL
ncbi:MAG: methyltransferase domain-containing protein [Candidatus Bathyarchaeota archaeon]|nr:MAG: methyltransferase domain-containing protein [Candidatus Bathyarchaeota archaeon]